VIDAGHDGRSPIDAANVLLAQWPGRQVNTDDAALAEQLLLSGAATVRHSFVMRCSPLHADLIDPNPTRLRLADLPRTGDPELWARILPSWRAAFPPEHPDHLAVDDADAIAFFLPLIDGTELGPLHRASTLVVDQAGVPIAGIIINVRSHERWGGPWIADFWRDPSLRGHGIGSMLISRVKRLLAEDCYDALSLAVTDGNDARRAYEHEGFVDVLESWSLRLPDEAS